LSQFKQETTFTSQNNSLLADKITAKFPEMAAQLAE
jgi:hypothetical protein